MFLRWKCTRWDFSGESPWVSLSWHSWFKMFLKGFLGNPNVWRRFPNCHGHCLHTYVSFHFANVFLFFPYSSISSVSCPSGKPKHIYFRDSFSCPVRRHFSCLWFFCRYRVCFTEGILEFQILRLLCLFGQVKKKKNIMMCNMMIWYMY